MSALIVGLLLLLPGSAGALETNELIAIAAMPLAVAAVSDIAEVPTGDLMSVVSAMNRAQVPAPQFVEVVRYVPVALVDRTEPTFVSYVTTQVGNGLVGDALAGSLADRMVTTYGVSEINVVNPQTVYVVERREFVPAMVTARLQPVDPLALVAMPLAVAAVANLTDVPANDLISFISALNRAAVPAPQFVEVVRYSPVVFLDDTPQFISFVTTEVDRGTRGEALAIVIADRFRNAGAREINVARPPQTFLVDRTGFLPPIVRTRVAERRAHPHGGPPGQLKKAAGLQTGAEIVHGTTPRPRVVVHRDDDDKGKARKNDRVTRQEPRRQDERRDDRGKSRDKAKDNSKGKGKGKG
ncbi:MAG: hypothetical protein M3P06_04765 [Acidobacteriota bacterium]|nr:hypothetical protein [Acidobacteriota bacterium]